MSDDNLESLDNVSLRKKCLEYGLPNVPITDTSRKLLIRRLRAAISGKPLDSKDTKKNRRETIHVSKIPAPVEAVVSAPAEEAPSVRVNRRTIAATSVTSTVDDTSLSAASKPAPVTDRRRSVRSKVEQEAAAPIPVSQKRKTAALVEEEEDEDDVILLEAAEQSEREIVIPRTRRSVSLSKTGVVTTSYSQDTVVTPSTVNETESESDNDFVANYASSYEPLTRPVAQPPRQLPRDTTFGITQRKTTIDPDRISSFRTTTVNRTSIDPEPVYNPPPQPTSRYSSLGSGYSTNPAPYAANTSSYSANTSTSTATRRFTTGGGYGISKAPEAKYSSLYGDEEEDEENQEETPYLSDFARKLERLAAEPLAKGAQSGRNIPIKRESERYHSSITGRRSTAQKESVADSFRNLLVALERKYKLKRNFSILFAVIVILFIYIVFVR